MISNFTHSSDLFFFNAKKKRSTLIGLVLAFFVLNSSFLTAQTQTVIVTNAGNGSWTVPPNVTSITVEAWGGGGAGGGTGSNSARGGGGGAGGTYVRSVLDVVPGQEINYQVGAGATGGTTAGGTGTASWFRSAAELNAQGGFGGAAPNGGNVNGGVGSISASVGTIRTAGGNGGNGSAAVAGNGGNGGNGGGAGGNSGGGGGNGYAGQQPGGGGGGAYVNNTSNRIGGSGGTGQIRITYTGYCTPVSSSSATYINSVSSSGGTFDFSNANSGVSASPFGYQNFYDTHAITVNPGDNFTVTFTIAGGRNNVSAGAKIWIDWNKNNIFENGESVYSGNRIGATVTTPAMTIPGSATPGNYVMRIVYDYNTGDPDSCGFSGTTRGEAEDYKIIIPPPCAGTPAGGTAAIAPGTGAVNSNFNVSVTGSATASGISYQWQISANGTTGWTDIAGATSAGTTTLTAVPLAGTTRYYRRKVTCANGGGTSYSSTVAFTTNAVSYCNGTVQAPGQLFISSLAIVGTMSDPPVNNSGQGLVSGYSNFTGLSPLAQQAQGEGINIAASLGGSDFGSGRWKAWVDWNGDGDFNDAGELVYNVATSQATLNFGFIVPVNQTPGNYRVRIRVNNGKNCFFFCDETGGYDFGVCDNFTGTGNSGNYGETEDYLITVVENCAAKITSVTNATDCGAPGGKALTLAASASQPVTEFRWYDSLTGAVIGTSAPDATGMSTTFTTPLLTSSAVYYVTAYNGNCESTFRVPVRAEIKPTPGITFTPSSLEVCGETSVVSVTATGGNEVAYLIARQTFEDGSLGVFTAQNISNNGGTYNARTLWQNRTSVYIPSQPNYLTWYPAISSGFGNNNFLLATSDVGNLTPAAVEKGLISPVNLDSRGFSNLTLKFRMFFSRYRANGVSPNDEYVSVEISTNNGTAWTEIERITQDVGQGTNFAEKVYNLNAYTGVQQLRIRIRYYAATWSDGVAVDDIELYGERPLQPSFVWSSSNPIGVYTDAAGTNAYTGGPISTVFFKPSIEEIETYSNWNLTATASLANGCNAVGGTNIVNNSKIWNPTATVNLWHSAVSWKPATGVPTADKCVVVKKPVIINPAISALAKNIKIETTGATGKLTINGSLTVTDGITNTGAAEDLVVKSDANLKQINKYAVNTGNISVRRLFTWSDASRKEYNYLSSPVAGQNMKEIFGPAANVLYVTKLNESSNTFVNAAVSDYQTKAKGFAVREPKTTYTGIPGQGIASNEAQYRGVPNNGDVTIGLDWTSAGRGYNLVGNPYPSNIDIVKLYQNSVSGFVNPEISADFRFWDNTVNATYVQMGGAYQGYSYAVLNAISNYSVAAPGLDPNPGGGGTGMKAPGSVVKVNQAFIMRALKAGSSVKFNNEMRETNNAGSIFYGKETPHNRYRLQLRTAENFVVQNAVTYIAAGQNIFGHEDSRIPNSAASDALFTYAGDAKVIINGRSIFTDEDILTLGLRHFSAGSYKIEAVDREGIFANGQAIYLKDKALNTLTDLTQGDYTFTSEAGEFTSRFEIVYKPGAVLATDSSAASAVAIYRDAADFVIRSSDKAIINAALFDASGRLVSTMKGSGKELRFAAERLSEGMYVLKATLKDGEEVTRKIRK